MSQDQNTVVIIHGSLMGPPWMKFAEYLLLKEGFLVHNIGYQTRRHNVFQHAENICAKIKEKEVKGELMLFGFSLGGLISWALAQNHPELSIKRLVLLGSPNKGSEVADYMDSSRHWRWLYQGLFGNVKDDLKAYNNPFLSELKPLKDCEVGIIGGSVPGKHHLLAHKIPSPNDGLVSEESLSLDWAKDKIMLNVSHTELIFRRSVIRQVIAFLKEGQFHHHLIKS